ncbi:hypothetical protein [Marinoscillum furvescens]|nr:hypothetical protein [Marinoscillum furvescens]
MEATYELDLWVTIDSLVSGFWTKPEEIPMIIGVSDGGETEMVGRKNGNYHRVFSTNASVQDPQFDSLAHIISEQLYWNTWIEHHISQNDR